MEHTSLCTSISALLEQNNSDAEWWQETRQHLAEAERWAHMECIRIRMEARAAERAEEQRVYELHLGPSRKARIKSFIAAALRGRPRRWAFVVPRPHPGGVIQGEATTWRQAMDAVAFHQKRLIEAEESRRAPSPPPSPPAPRHRGPADGGGEVAHHQPREAQAAPLVGVGAPDGGRHVPDQPVAVHRVPTPPPRDFALAALADPAPRRVRTLAASELIARLTQPVAAAGERLQSMTEPIAPVIPLHHQIEEMRLRGAVR